MSPRPLSLSLLLALPLALTMNVDVGPDGAATPGARPVVSPRVSGPRAAEAAVAIQISLDELVAASSYVVVATATEQRSQWEEIGGAKRIVTYTRLAVDRAVAGEPDKEIWVRTLGGVVGKIGQVVSGDAQLAIGAQSLLFLKKIDGAVVVAAMAQGHYPVEERDETPTGAARRVLLKRLAASPDTGAVLPRRGPAISAREVLIGATLDAALDAVNKVWKAQHAQK